MDFNHVFNVAVISFCSIFYCNVARIHQ